MNELQSFFQDWITNPLVLHVFAIVFTTLLVAFLFKQLFDRLEVKLGGTPTVWDDALFHSVRRPMTLLIWILGVSWAAQVVSAHTESDLAQLIEPVRYIAVVGVIVLFLFKFVGECEQGFVTQHNIDVTTATAIGKLIRISILITGALTVLQTLGISISGILAFGGVGGIAVGFAAKDLLANFFGGLMIYLDRPFVIGDWVRSPDRSIEGTVEHIGWRLTVIRTFDQRPLYVPNSVFTSIALENPSRMRNRRIYETIGIRYADVAEMAGIVADVKAMLKSHDAIDTEKTMIVNFNQFAASSLDFFIYTFTKTTNWVEYHEIKQDVLLKVHDIIEAHHAEIAFPTSTVHLAAEPEAES